MAINDPLAAVDFGFDDDDQEDVIMVMTTDDDGQRHGMFIPSNLRKSLTFEQMKVAQQVQESIIKIQQLQDDIDALAVKGRNLGMSWAAVGWSAGLTAEGARKRWSE